MEVRPRIAAIIGHEARGDEHNWEAARLIAEELAEGIMSHRDLGRAIGKSHRHVGYMARVWNLWITGNLGSQRPPFTEVYRSTAVRGEGAHVGHNSGDNEWFTPMQIIAAARAVMGGIDLDPASTPEANKVVGAARFYTARQDGLSRPWAGRVWLNPPYARTLVDRFCTRLGREYAVGTVRQAIVLVNNATETAWFQALATQASVICFPKGRVRCWQPRKCETSTPLQGQAVLYLGLDAGRFVGEFDSFGLVAPLARRGGGRDERR